MWEGTPIYWCFLFNAGCNLDLCPFGSCGGGGWVSLIWEMNQGECDWSQKQHTHQFLEMFNTLCHNPMTSFLPMNFCPTITIVLVDHTSGCLLRRDRDEESFSQKGRSSLRGCGKRWWRWNDIMPMMWSRRKNKFTVGDHEHWLIIEQHNSLFLDVAEHLISLLNIWTLEPRPASLWRDPEELIDKGRLHPTIMHLSNGWYECLSNDVTIRILRPSEHDIVQWKSVVAHHSMDPWKP